MQEACRFCFSEARSVLYYPLDSVPYLELVTQCFNLATDLLDHSVLPRHYEPEWGLGGGETRSPRRGEARGSCHTPLEPSGPVHYGKTCEQKCTTT